MNHAPHETVERRLQRIGEALPATLKGADRQNALRFIELYFSGVPLDDLVVQDHEDLAGAAMAHWQMQREPLVGDYRLRVYNPNFESDGWQSTHTVIEFVALNRPYLVSTLQAALRRHRLQVHLLLHPIVSVQRNEHGVAELVQARDSHVGQVESLIHIEIDRVEGEDLEALDSDLRTVMDVLQAVQRDQQAMQSRLKSLVVTGGHSDHSEFLDWLSDSRFTLLGIGSYTVSHDQSARRDGDPLRLVPITDRCLGLLSVDNPLNVWQINTLIPTESLQRMSGPDCEVVVCKAIQRSPIIRHDHADVILFPEHQEGVLNQLHCLVGLLHAREQRPDVQAIPLLQQRIERVVAASSIDLDSHDGKSMLQVLGDFPRDMLLQTDSRTLATMARDIVSLHERQTIRLFHSTDTLGRYCNCLVYIPRDAYSRELRLQIESILLERIDGESADYQVRFSTDSELARLYFIVRKRPPLNREIDWRAIESAIGEAAVNWDERLRKLLLKHHDETLALTLYRRYERGFPASYLENYSARAAVSDIGLIESELKTDAPLMHFHHQPFEDGSALRFKLLNLDQAVPLSDVIAIIEHFGLRIEAGQPYHIRRHDDADVYMHEFTVRHSDGRRFEDDSVLKKVEEAWRHVWRSEAENDGFNRLILDAGLDWRQVVILRSYSKYLLQIGVPFSQSYMIDCLVANADITRQLLTVFEQRFDPQRTEHNTDVAVQSIHDALDDVASLDQDRILRAFLIVILATQRTNAYLQDEQGEPLDYVSYKIDSRAIPELPLPRPLVEIFVYSPAVEGIHLRGGRVARGGLRWSDRREDFRTEVLGLMKAQMVKNSVIVPVGSKGGFYVKLPTPADREHMMANGVACYRTFLRGLLDVTDNIVSGEVVPPARVVRHDDDDPYLVVAADKGTATFSDFANEVSAQYGFWLGDAFASGGSAGYDHKKMGITARGAWESVKRHFRELGHNTQEEDFTVVGIGDMGGDVFGNGMLLSEHIRLVAAFNHMHIFIDPTPDSARSFAERKRLFELPRSSWADYDLSLISAGGALYNRHDKQLELSPEAMQALGTEQSRFTPTELISTILKAPVDLLWNGGIGTYVKASTETHADAADRGNDAVRINGRDLRCRVVGEGGNLGFTQRARIEFAQNGGLIYTDAIDNSAGVDCSDHEVNIKILLNSVEDAQELTRKQRDELLAQMTDEVAELVLRDNYLQTQCINLTHSGGADALTEQSRFMQHLESRGRLDRAIEYLPDAEQIADRLAARQGLHRPEISVLVSYSKMVMYDDMLKSDFADHQDLHSLLNGYFPDILAERYADQIAEHRLRREIITTLACNDLVNRLGPTFAFRLNQEIGASARDVSTAFVAASQIFQMPALWSAIESLDNQIPAATQNQMLILVRGLVERGTHWLLRYRRGVQSVEELIAQFAPGIRELEAAMPECLAEGNLDTWQQRLDHFNNAGVPDDTSRKVASVVPLSSSLDIVDIASSLSMPVAHVAAVYFELGRHLDLHWLRERIALLPVTSHWHTLARSELRNDLHYQQRHLSAEVLAGGSPDQGAQSRVHEWAEANTASVEKYQSLVHDMKAGGSVDFAMLSLATSEVHKLLGGERPLGAS